MSKKKLKRVFIANRGEIARRIAETAKKIGLETVCLVEGKPPSYLLGFIDEFISVEEESVSLYLDAEKLLSYAKASKCDCLHPGFGFLAENAAFAKMVEGSGITWIGPKSEVISMMADKSAAREVAQKNKVPCLKGLNHFSHKNKEHHKALDQFCQEADFPLLIKAAFGGGGKGMRVVQSKDELFEKLETASREAKSSFGNDTLVIEEYVPESRHVEVQVLGDSSGQVKILGDRDCSIQRRHQKIIEEAPAPYLSDALRKGLHDAAYNLSKGIAYTSCGTVEFLVPWDMEKNQSQKENFYFLEMNTRLQVEHPVTEEVFGIDIVELQFDVAQGRNLTQKLMESQPSGHSFEARIYMEDPQKGFLPAPGFVAGFLPYEQRGLRWEVGIDSAEMVSGKFDPMIAKLIATGKTRDEACYSMRTALEKTFIGAERQNIGLLWEIFSDTFFLERSVSTSYLDHHLQRLLDSLKLREEKAKVYLRGISEELRRAVDEDVSGNERSGQFDVRTVSDLSYGLSPFLAPKTEIAPLKNQLVRKNVFINLKHEKEKVFYYCFLNTLIKSEASLVHLSFMETSNGEKLYRLGYDGFVLLQKFEEKSWKGSEEGARASSHDICADVPGKVVKVLVKEHEKLKKDQSCFVLESMKMEFDIRSASNCSVKRVFVKEGDQVESGKILAKLDI